jgi:hypothetical protein
MAQAQMIEGTTEEIIQQLQQNYAGQKLRVYIELQTTEPSVPTEKPHSRSERFVSQPGEMTITPPQKSTDGKPKKQ